MAFPLGHKYLYNRELTSKGGHSLFSTSRFFLMVVVFVDIKLEGKKYVLI